MSDTVSGILGLVAALLVPAVLLAGAAAGLYRTTRQNLPADEARRKAKKVFWITFLILVAVELILLGFCLAVINGMG